MSSEDSEMIFNDADMNNSGYIDYMEWIQATIDKKLLLTENHLREAFDAFDEDHDGNISLDEIKKFLSWGKEIKEKIWNEILDEVDTNKDGYVDFNEFKNMMKTLIK